MHSLSFPSGLALLAALQAFAHPHPQGDGGDIIGTNYVDSGAAASATAFTAPEVTQIGAIDNTPADVVIFVDCEAGVAAGTISCGSVPLNISDFPTATVNPDGFSGNYSDGFPVDPTNSRRHVKERAVTIDTPDNIQSPTLDLAKRDEINSVSADPLMQVISWLGVANLVSNPALMTNRFPAALRGRYVIGLTGTLATAVRIGSFAFAQGAPWIIRYDFADGAQNGLQGAHVNFAIGGRETRQAWGVYLNNPTPFSTEQWYADVVRQLTALAGNSTPAAAAAAIAAFWQNLYNTYSKDL